MKKYKYITIEEDGEYNDKPSYDVIDNKSGNRVGWIFWDGIKKQFGYESTSVFFFYTSCLVDIAAFMKELG